MAGDHHRHPAGRANPASCAAVEALIYPAVLQETPGAVTRRVRRVLARVDSDALRLKAAKERLDLGVPPACGGVVHAYPSQVPGLTTWVASLPAADSAACWAAIDALAHQMSGVDPTEDVPSSVELRWRPDDHQAAFTVSS